MTCYLHCGTKAFAGNAILLEVLAATQAVVVVMSEGYQVYRGNAAGSFTLNLSELLEPLFTNYNQWQSGTDGYPYLLTPFRRSDYQVDCTVIVTDPDSTTWSRSFTAVRGGVPKRLFRQLEEAGTTFFAKKDRMDANNFFTLRSNGWRISLKETELDEPLMVLLPSEGTGRMVVKSEDGAMALELTGTAGGFFGLDLKAVRTYFCDEYDRLCSSFRIYNERTGGSLALASSIAIERAEAAPERYRVRWRTSLGVMETMELVGKAEMEHASEADSDGEASLEYDAVTDSYKERRGRVEMRETVVIPSGIKRLPEILMLRDMLSSDEVYLVADDGEQWRVIPTCEELTVPLQVTEPQSFGVRFRMTEGESLTGFCFIDGDFVKPGIFQRQFEDQYM